MQAGEDGTVSSGLASGPYVVVARAAVADTLGGGGLEECVHPRVGYVGERDGHALGLCGGRQRGVVVDEVRPGGRLARRVQTAVVVEQAGCIGAQPFGGLAEVAVCAAQGVGRALRDLPPAVELADPDKQPLQWSSAGR